MLLASTKFATLLALLTGLTVGAAGALELGLPGGYVGQEFGPDRPLSLSVMAGVPTVGLLAGALLGIAVGVAGGLMVLLESPGNTDPWRTPTLLAWLEYVRPGDAAGGFRLTPRSACLGGDPHHRLVLSGIRGLSRSGSTRTRQERIMKHRIVVLGAGYAGAFSAGYLARQLHSDDFEITVVNAEPDFVERLRLHQLAAGQDLRHRPLAEVFEGTDIRLRVARVISVDTEQRTVTVADGEGIDRLEYDTLLYALGSTVADNGVAGVDEHAFHVAARPAALRLRARLNELGEDGHVLVVGGNLTAIESVTEIAESRPGLRVRLATRGNWAAGWAPRPAVTCFVPSTGSVSGSMSTSPSSASRQRRRSPPTAPFSPPMRPCGPPASPCTRLPPPVASRWNPTGRSRSTGRCARSRTRMSTLLVTVHSSSATTVSRCRCRVLPRDTPVCRRRPRSSGI